MPGSSWVPRVRRTAIAVVCVWALANVLLADSAANHAQARLDASRQRTGATAPSGEPAPLVDTSNLRKGVSASSLERRIRLFQLLVVLIGAASALALLAWQAGAAARLVHVDPAGVRYGPARVVRAWLVPGMNLAAPARSVTELFARTEGGGGRRTWWGLVVGLWWAACLSYVGLAIALLAARVSSNGVDEAGRDHLLEVVGLVGVAVAALSAVMVIWIDVRLADREIPEPEHPWAGWAPIRGPR